MKKRQKKRMVTTGDSYGCFTLGKRLGEGRTRTTFQCKEHPGLVIKVPGGDDRDVAYGKQCNEAEAKLFEKHGRNKHPCGIRLAKCTLLHNGWLVMEKVNPVFEPCRGRVAPGRRPHWARLIDSDQFGRDERGRFVAFDYGDCDCW